MIKTRKKNKTATPVVLVSAGTALAACADEAQPKLRLLQLPAKRVNRKDVREARGLEVNRLAGMQINLKNLNPGYNGVRANHDH